MLILGVNILNLFSWIIFGLIIGLVAHLSDPEPVKGGLIGTIILGLTGAIVGGFLANFLFGVMFSGFNLSTFLIAVAGSLLLVLIYRMIFQKPKTTISRF